MLDLANGTSVDADALRATLLDRAGGILERIVVCGDKRDYLAILAWPSVKGCSDIAGGEMSVGMLSVAEVVREHVRDLLRAWNKENPKQRIARALLVGDESEPVDDLYAEPTAAGVILG